MKKMKIKVPLNETFLSKKEFFIKYSKYFDLNFYECFDGCKWNGGRIGKQTPLNDEIIDFLKDIPSEFSFVFTNTIIDKCDTCIEHIEKIKNLNKNISFIIRDKNYEFFNHLKKIYDAKLVLTISEYERTFTSLSMEEEVHLYIDYLKSKIDKYDEIVLRGEILLIPNDDLKKLKSIFDFNKFNIIYNADQKCYFCPLYMEHHLLGNYNGYEMMQNPAQGLLRTCLLPIRNTPEFIPFFKYQNNFYENVKEFKKFKFVDRRSPVEVFLEDFQEFLQLKFVRKYIKRISNV